jgi:hypothetical protein
MVFGATHQFEVVISALRAIAVVTLFNCLGPATRLHLLAALTPNVQCEVSDREQRVAHITLGTVVCKRRETAGAGWQTWVRLVNEITYETDKGVNGSRHMQCKTVMNQLFAFFAYERHGVDGRNGFILDLTQEQYTAHACARGCPISD